MKMRSARTLSPAMSGKTSDDAPRLIREYFSYDRDLDNLFVEAGRQARVVGRLDGSFGGLRAVSTETPSATRAGSGAPRSTTNPSPGATGVTTIYRHPLFF